MATIDLTDVQFYKGGRSGVSQVVGYEDSSRRVARYTFTAPANGARGAKLTFHTAGRQAGSHVPLRFFIGTDPDSHANAGADSEYTGELTLDSDGWVVFTGSADILLLPNAVYYLWVFPASDTFGWYSWQRSGYTSSMEVEGSAGAVNIWINGEKKKAIPRIYKGGQWKHTIPRIYKGGDWKIPT